MSIQIGNRSVDEMYVKVGSQLKAIDEAYICIDGKLSCVHSAGDIVFVSTNGKTVKFSSKKPSILSSLSYSDGNGNVNEPYKSNSDIGTFNTVKSVGGSKNCISSIAASCFKNCTNLVDISLSNCIYAYGTDTFENCKSLTAVYTPNLCGAITPEIFKGSDNLLCVDVDNSRFKSYGNGYDMPKQLVIYEYNPPEHPLLSSANLEFAVGGITEACNLSVTSINANAFGATPCKRLSVAIFPSCMTIYSKAFMNCTSLDSISFPVCTHIYDQAFKNCTSLTQAEFSKCIYIDDSAFMDCTSLTSASFISCITIGSNAFAYCTALTEASFPACTYIGQHAFYNCSALTTASFPVCASISSYAFRNCSALTTASFQKCTYIGEGAFSSCKNLTSLYLTGSSVCTLANSDAFEGTPSTMKIYVPTSLVTKYQSSTTWKYYSSRFVEI